MGRDLTVGAAAAIAAEVVYPVAFYEGEYATGTVRLWSGVGPIDWDGKTWTGAGQMLGISSIEETSEIRASAFAVSLSGDVAALMQVNLAAARTGLPGRVWIGFFDSAGALVADPFMAFAGRFDVPDLVIGGARATIEVRYESRLIDLDRPRIRRYTHEDHQIDYPGDRGFEYVSSIQDKEVVWGRAAPGQAQTVREVLQQLKDQ